ncbi:MAG: hypothetical protein NTW29_17385 [Bacteroidetes bacterium]|nr:hypothetical protein [Bacteroidota bacterium]
MFNLFKKKEPEIKIVDKVCMEPAGKLELLYKAWQADQSLVILFWFDDSLQTATDFFAQKTAAPVNLILAREFSPLQRAGKPIVFGEHYPLRKPETDLIKNMGLTSIEVYSSLKDLLFRMFDGERIINVMSSLGMKEDEVIQHSMISSSIRKAQDKLEKEITVEHTARSTEAWFKMNINQ